MRILIIHKLPPFNRGGAEQIIWRIAKKFAGSGHEVVFFSPRSEMDREPPEVDGIDYEWVSTSNTQIKSQLEFFIKGPKVYPEVYNRVDPDLVYDNICPFPFHMAHFYGDADVVSKVHAVYRRDAISCKESWPVKLGTIAGEETYRLFRDEKFIINSYSTKQRLSKLLNENRNELIANPIGIDPSEFEFNFDPNSSTVLSLAKLTPRKNISTLLKAWRRVEEKNPEAELVIAGTGPREKKLHDLSAELRLNSVRFEGFVSEKRKRALLENSLIYTLPTLYEGFGLSNLEAMASGCAVISTNTWGVKDYLQDGMNGLAIERRAPSELATAILKLLDDRELCETLATRGMHTANKHRISDSLNREIDLLTDSSASPN